MSYSLIIKPPAQEDIEESAVWYEQESTGLGHEFIQAVEEKLEVIEKNPNLFEVKYKQVHQAFLYRFPFSIHYIVEAENIFVVAVLHTNSDPKTALKRSK